MSEEPAAVAAFDEFVGTLDFPMYIVTTAVGPRRAGCLVGFASQCSISPARFMAWVSKANHTYEVVGDASAVVVHRLSEDDVELARLFGSNSGFEVDKFARCRWRPGPAGVPVLEDCADWFAGEILARHDTGDHVGLVLRPIAAAIRPGAGPQLGFQAVRGWSPGNEA